VQDVHHAEVDDNFLAFTKMLPELLQSSPGKFALLHNQNLVAVFNSSIAAFIEGMKQFGENRYSIQEISDQADNLGFYSYAGGAGQA
jgi:hypothetical protein